MANNKIVTQICVVVNEVRQANANWARVLGMPEAAIDTIITGLAERRG